MHRIITALSVTLIVFSNLYSSQPERWLVSTTQEFLAGDFKGVSLDSEGKLVLSPGLEAVYETGQALIHSAAVDPSGRIYLGTGNEGRIFAVLGQSGEQLADLEENGVFGLAIDNLNRIYAATAPGGKVYRIDRQGNVEPFFDPREKYIWDLKIDRDNNLYVATGPKGIVYRVDPQGRGSVYYDSNDTHITSLAFDLAGNLLAGSSGEGLIFRIDAKDKAFVLFDSTMEEIKSLAVDRYGNVFAVGLSYEPGAAPAAAGKTPAKKPAVPAAPSKNGDEDTIAVEGTRKGKKLEIYRIDRDSLVETIYTADAEMAFDLSVRDDGTVLAGTSNKGRVIAVSPRKLLRVLVQTPDDQVTRLIESGGQLYAASSNLGKLYRLSTESALKGSYESDVLDAKIVSSWGNLRWRVGRPGENPPLLHTRSGNTAKPDSTWSEWSEAYRDSDGSAVQSPAARYLQWKAEFRSGSSSAGLTSDRNALESVEISYLQRNMAPVIGEVTVHPPGTAFLKIPVSNQAGGGSLGGPDNAHLLSLPRSVRALETATPTPPPRKVYVQGSRSVSWKAKDPNEDDLVYSVFYRGIDEQSWKLLAENRTEDYYTLDGASLPDGIYTFRIVASDRPSNPPSSELEAELVSKSFVISNTAPTVTLSQPRLQDRSASFDFTARTTASLVYQAEFSLDAQAWRIVYPQDGISDSLQESFQVVMENLSRGEHLLTVRVIDSIGNIGTAKATFTVP